MSQIPYYLELQRRICNIFRFVSCHEDNFDTYSIMLESLLVDTCSFYDSLCQTFIRQRKLAGHVFRDEASIPDFARKVAGGADFNFADYRSLLQGEFQLSRREVSLNQYEGALNPSPLQSDPRTIQGYLVSPYTEWAQGNPSPWWKAFTALKHDRLANLRHATLRHTIFSMAALFIVLTLSEEAEFKRGRVPGGVYDLFLPKYWNFNGVHIPGIFMWQ